MRPLLKGRIGEAIEMREKRMKCSSIASVLGVSTAQISRALKAVNVKKPDPSEPPLNLAIAIAMRKDNMTYAEIGRRIGMTHQGVHVMMKRWNERTSL